MPLFSRLTYLSKHIDIKSFKLRREICYCCHKRLLVRLNKDEMGVRCVYCGASAVAQSLARIFHQKTSNHEPLSVYELSGRGAFVRMLQNTNHHITLSEFFPDTVIGKMVDGILCQDVQNLSFADEQFDVCTSLEVFEHVEDDQQGFKELYRVLKPGGFLIFTVPIDLNHQTIERTAIVNGRRQAILPKEYHSDHLRGTGQVFCYRNYGHDIVDRLSEAGFSQATIIRPQPDILFGCGRPVIYARK